jgi:hypothetical protein
VGWYRNTCSDRHRPRRCSLAEAEPTPSGSPDPRHVSDDSRTRRGPDPRQSMPSGWLSQTRGIGSSTSFAAVRTTRPAYAEAKPLRLRAGRSRIVGMPSGRSPPPGFGIITRRTGWHRYVFARSSSPSRDSQFSNPVVSICSNVTPSTPGAPSLARARLVPAKAGAIRVAQNVRPPDLVIQDVEPGHTGCRTGSYRMWNRKPGSVFALSWSFLREVRIASGVRRLIANHLTSFASKTYQKPGSFPPPACA